MFPYTQYLLHKIEEGFVCTLCGSEVPVKIQKRARTKYAWETIYIENVNPKRGAEPVAEPVEVAEVSRTNKGKVLCYATVSKNAAGN